MNEESEDSYIGSGPSILAMTSLHTNQVVVLSTRVVVLQQGDFSLWSIDTSRVWLVFFFPTGDRKCICVCLNEKATSTMF